MQLLHFVCIQVLLVCLYIYTCTYFFSSQEKHCMEVFAKLISCVLVYVSLTHYFLNDHPKSRSKKKNPKLNKKTQQN